jgi:hypothetical protein
MTITTTTPPATTSYGAQVDFPADVSRAAGIESVRAVYLDKQGYLGLFDTKTSEVYGTVAQPTPSNTTPALVISNASIPGSGLGDLNVYLKTDGSIYVAFDGYPIDASAPAQYGPGGSKGTLPPATGSYDPPEVEVAHGY